MKRLLWARTGKVAEVAKELEIVCKVYKEVKEDLEKEVAESVIAERQLAPRKQGKTG